MEEGDPMGVLTRYTISGHGLNLCVRRATGVVCSGSGVQSAPIQQCMSGLEEMMWREIHEDERTVDA